MKYLRAMKDALLTAEKLLQANAVQLRPAEPYTWASGWKSPIYCDNRKLLSLPYIRDFIKSSLCNEVFEKFADAELIAGVATAGIAWGALVADQLKLPFIYVRPKPKEHGLGNQIEGQYTPGQRTVVIEDLVSTGFSSLQVTDVLKSKSLVIEGMVSIFNYGFQASEIAFAKAGVQLYSLTNYTALIELAKARGLVRDEDEQLLLNWRLDPANWTGLA